MTLFTIIVGILLIVLNVRALRKEENSFNHKLHEVGDNMEEFEVLVGEVRREFSETILELQKEVEGLKDMLNRMDSKQLHFKEHDIGGNEEKIEYNHHSEPEGKEVDNDLEKNAKIERTKGRTKKTVAGKKDTDKQKESDNRESNSSNNESNNSIKVNEVGRLLEEGLSVDEISQKLSIGKGEVLLIKELYLK